jgi:hypothetical protein
MQIRKKFRHRGRIAFLNNRTDVERVKFLLIITPANIDKRSDSYPSQKTTPRQTTKC